PMQRLVYHEFDNQPITSGQPDLGDTPERLAFIADYAEAMRRTGFNRETDRLVGRIGEGPSAWRRDAAPVSLASPPFAPPAWYGVPSGGSWETEDYLDQAVRFGLRYDSQLLGHCSSVRFHERWFPELVPPLERAAQAWGRYPSFYGFNYNDEMFF